jgi:hypothetical protein
LVDLDFPDSFVRVFIDQFVSDLARILLDLGTNRRHLRTALRELLIQEYTAGILEGQVTMRLDMIDPQGIGPADLVALPLVGAIWFQLEDHLRGQA